MKNNFYFLILLLTTSLSIGQTKKNKSTKSTFKESDVIFKFDSLSIVYQVKVLGYKSVFQDGKIKHFICYGEGNELIEY